MGLRLAAQGTSTGSAKSWAVILWRRELRTFGLKTPLDKIIYYIHLFVFKNTIFAQKYFFCDWSLFPKSILPSDGGDPKRPEQDANPPFSFTCSAIMTIAIKKISTYDNDAKKFLRPALRSRRCGWQYLYICQVLTEKRKDSAKWK